MSPRTVAALLNPASPVGGLAALAGEDGLVRSVVWTAPGVALSARGADAALGSRKLATVLETPVAGA